MNVFQISGQVDVGPILMGLQRNPDLWGQYSIRKKMEIHKEMDDIWVRYRNIEDFDGNLNSFNGPHYPVWYPAWYGIPELRPIVFGLMQRMGATHLGGILITKIPPGGKVKPHIDTNGWHASFYETKLYVVLAGNDRCWNRVGEHKVTMKTGEIWYFDNQVEHEVVNEGDSDRITLIVCMTTK